MTELELYKFINDNGIEYHYYNCYDKNKKIMMFVNIYDIDEFNKLLGKRIMEEEGINCVMKYGYFCFEMIEICEYFDIVPENVFTKKD